MKIDGDECVCRHWAFIICRIMTHLASQQWQGASQPLHQLSKGKSISYPCWLECFKPWLPWKKHHLQGVRVSVASISACAQARKCVARDSFSFQLRCVISPSPLSKNSNKLKRSWYSNSSWLILTRPCAVEPVNGAVKTLCDPKFLAAPAKGDQSHIRLAKTPSKTIHNNKSVFVTNFYKQLKCGNCSNLISMFF